MIRLIYCQPFLESELLKKGGMNLAKNRRGFLKKPLSQRKYALSVHAAATIILLASRFSKKLTEVRDTALCSQIDILKKYIFSLKIEA